MRSGNQYVEVRSGGYYVAGTRLGLDLIAHAFRNGRSAESILASFPSIGSLARIYGVLTFILEHPAEVDDYLAQQDRLFDAVRASHPLPKEMLRAFEQRRRE